MKASAIVLSVAMAFALPTHAQVVDKEELAKKLTLDTVPGHIENGAGNDTTGVLKLISGFQVALFRGDARAFADLFAEDADFTNVVDHSIHGRDHIYTHHIDVFKGRPPTRTNNLLSGAFHHAGCRCVGNQVG